MDYRSWKCTHVLTFRSGKLVLFCGENINRVEYYVDKSREMALWFECQRTFWFKRTFAKLYIGNGIGCSFRTTVATIRRMTPKYVGRLDQVHRNDTIVYIIMLMSDFNEI